MKECRKIAELHVTWWTDHGGYPHILYALDRRLIVGGMEDFSWPGEVDKSAWEKLPGLPDVP